MPDSRKPRVWMTMLVALVALLAFVPQAGAREDESDEPVEACVAHDYGDEDSCSEDGPKGDEPRDCMARGDDYEDSCSKDEPGDDEPEGDEPKDEPDHTQSCEDGPVAGSRRSLERQHREVRGRMSAAAGQALHRARVEVRRRG